MPEETYLVILRGNSGSGKTTAAKALQKKMGHGTMLISQDVVRREMLYVKDGLNSEAGELMFELALYGKKHCSVIILEGILNADWYKELFVKILKEFGERIAAYFFDIPFEETLLRHAGKPNAKEFGAEEMRKWWNDKALIKVIPEVLLGKELSSSEIVEMVYGRIKERQ